MKILVPITVKVVVTEAFLFSIRQEIDHQIRKIDTELDQIGYQLKILELEMAKTPKDSFIQTFASLEAERLKRQETRIRMLERKKESAQLNLGSEVLHSQVEGTYEVQIGDVWQETSRMEILLKDGVVAEIRNGK